MADWDQNEQLYETDSEEFFKRLEEERNHEQGEVQVVHRVGPVVQDTQVNRRQKQQNCWINSIRIVMGQNIDRKCRKP